MKKRKIILLILIAVLFFVLVNLWDEIIISCKIIVNCNKDYSNDFSYQSIFIDDTEKEISIKFKSERNISNESIPIIEKIYDYLYDLLYSEYNSKWDEYCFNIYIKDTTKETLFVIKDISKTKEKIEIRTFFDNVDILAISNLCEEASIIDVSSIEYNNLSDFSGFTNLKQLRFNFEPMDDNVESYILSKFPNCKISWKEE